METIPFTVPDEKVRQLAIGSIAGTPIRMKKALKIITPLFDPIPKPGPSDWLADHDEDGQTYEAYISQRKNYVDETRNVIYIQPLEDINKEFVEKLSKFTQAYYHGLKVKIRKVVHLENLEVDNRKNEQIGKIQYNATQILRELEGKLPTDSYCMIAICMSDLYPRDEWNYVFGLASIKNRTGVFSFARYQETFFDDEDEQETKLIENSQLLWRSSKVMVHEIGHMFGLRHCIYFNCVMNGSNNLEENDRKPIFMCPVCIRKLQHNIKFEMVDRYRALADICYEFGGKFESAGKWYRHVEEAILEAYGPHYKLKKEEPMKKNENLKKTKKV